MRTVARPARCKNPWPKEILWLRPQFGLGVTRQVDASKLARLVAEPERLARYRAALPAVKSLTENADEIEARYREITWTP